ncbi:MAG: hypothetical protein WDM92_06580 [Caulobacteraceae bacterium]
MTLLSRLSLPVFPPAPGAPVDPRLAMVVAALLPGFGHVMCGQVRRGFTMQMFMICLGFITWHLSTPHTSLVGRLSGGLFVYALSIPEAYRIAKVRWAVARASKAG